MSKATATSYCHNGKFYVGVADVAKHLDVSEETVRRHLRLGKFKGAITQKGTWMIPQKYVEAANAAKDNG